MVEKKVNFYRAWGSEYFIKIIIILPTNSNYDRRGGFCFVFSYLKWFVLKDRFNDNFAISGARGTFSKINSVKNIISVRKRKKIHL